MSAVLKRIKDVRSTSSWREATLGEILPLKYGKARSERFGYVREQTSMYGSNGAFGTFERALTERPAIIVGRKGAAGLVHYSAEPCWPIDTAFYTEGSDRTFLPFFRYLLEGLQLAQFDRSTAIPSLSRDDYASRRILYPEDIPEQRRIVAEIEKQFTRLDVGATALRRVQANLKRYRAAILKAACEGRLVRTEAELAKAQGRKLETGEELLARILDERRKNGRGRGKYKEPVAPNAASLPQLPDGWTWTTLEQLCPLFVDSAHRTPKYESVGLPALGPRDVVGGRLNLTEARLVNESEFAIQTARHVPQSGDIVYSRELSLGWGAVVPVGQSLCLSQGMCLFRSSDAINLNYFLAMLNGPMGRKQAERSATGSAHPHINLGNIKAYTFPLSPVAEQTRIVAEVERRLSVVEELEAVVVANLLRATRLRQSILAQAFEANR